MDRRTFIQATAACLIAPVIPQALPEPILPAPVKFNYHDIYISPEALEDIKNWGVDQIDETTRREIYVSFDNES